MQVWFTGWLRKKEKKEKRSDLCRRRDVWSARFAFEFEQKTAKLSNGGAAPHVQRSLNLEETIICNLSHLRTQKDCVAWDNVIVGFGKCCFSYICFLKSWVNYLRKPLFDKQVGGGAKQGWLLAGSFQLISSGLGHIWLFHTWLTAWSGFKCWADNCALWRVCREAVSQIIFMSKRAAWTRAEEKLHGIKSISASAASQFWAITIIPYSIFLAYWMALSLPERQPGLCSCFWQHVSDVGSAIPFSHKSRKEGLEYYGDHRKIVFSPLTYPCGLRAHRNHS